MMQRHKCVIKKITEYGNIMVKANDFNSFQFALTVFEILGTQDILVNHLFRCP